MKPLKSVKKVVVTIVIVVVVAVLGISSFDIVEPNERAVKVTLGQIQGDTIEPGLIFHAPFVTQIKKISMVPTTISIDLSIGADAAVTQDLQAVGTTCNLQWRYVGTNVRAMVEEYSRANVEQAIRSAVLSAVKSSIGRYSIYDITSKQVEITAEVSDLAKSRTSQYPIEITQLTLNNFDWSSEFDLQIAETMARTQQVRQAEQDLLITEQNAQKQVREAEAERQAITIRAEAALEKARLDAEAQQIAGDALAYYNRRVAENLNVEIQLRQLEIEKDRIEKWDGHYVPEQTYYPIPVNHTGTMQGAGPNGQ